MPVPGNCGQRVPAPRAVGGGAQCEIQLTSRCLWMSPAPAAPSEPQLCPVLPCVSSTALQALPAMLGDHGTPDSKFLLLHLSVFFLPLSCIPLQAVTFPSCSHLSFSYRNTPRGFSLLQFVLLLASSIILVLQLLLQSPTVSGENKSSPSLAVA